MRAIANFSLRARRKSAQAKARVLEAHEESHAPPAGDAKNGDAKKGAVAAVVVPPKKKKRNKGLLSKGLVLTGLLKDDEDVLQQRKQDFARRLGTFYMAHNEDHSTPDKMVDICNW